MKEEYSVNYYLVNVFAKSEDPARVPSAGDCQSQSQSMSMPTSAVVTLLPPCITDRGHPTLEV